MNVISIPSERILKHCFSFSRGRPDFLHAVFYKYFTPLELKTTAIIALSFPPPGEREGGV